MEIIKKHNVVLEGKDGIVLVPLTDEHLPLLYRWNSDVEVLYWGEGDDITEPYDEEMVRLIYGRVSQNAYCFLIQKDEQPVGECWLQKMNLEEVSCRYEEILDVRRIDYCLGEKAVWGKGIGTECLRLLQKFAFEKQGVDVLYVIPYDYNLRSVRMVEHAGFDLEYEKPILGSQKAKFELFYKMTKEDYGNKTE